MTPLEEMAAIQSRWQEIENCVQINRDKGLFPFILTTFDRDYITVRQVVEGMGLYARKRPRKQGVVVCLSPKDRRRPVVPQIVLGAGAFYVTHFTTGLFGFSHSTIKCSRST